MRCVKDANGNHVSPFRYLAVARLTSCMQVIQKLIERVTPDLLGFVSAFQGNVYDLATHPYGCRVLQRCFEYLHEPQTRPLIEELHKYTTQLMQDQFGVSRNCLMHVNAADLLSRIMLSSLYWSMARQQTGTGSCTSSEVK
jgi:hypothetical protein